MGGLMLSPGGEFINYKRMKYNFLWREGHKRIRKFNRIKV